MMKIKLATLLILLCCASIANADEYKNADGITELNNQRIRHGLRPFIRDENLSRAAKACSKYRAKHRIAGHCSHYISNGIRYKLSDFYFIPRGCMDVSRVTGGCAAWPIGTVTICQCGGDTWGSCGKHDNYTYAGAWSHVGPDGIRYMHLFVR
jgi:hypothetical protein